MPLINNPDGTLHIHEFNRLKGTQTYRCVHPNCFTQYHKKLLLGKEAICGVCHKDSFILNYEQLRRAIPRCFGCSNTAEATARRERIAVLKKMGIS